MGPVAALAGENRQLPGLRPARFRWQISKTRGDRYKTRAQPMSRVDLRHELAMREFSTVLIEGAHSGVAFMCKLPRKESPNSSDAHRAEINRAAGRSLSKIHDCLSATVHISR